MNRHGLKVALVAAVLFFVWLAAEVARGAAMPFDLRVRALVHGLASGPLTDAMLAATQFGSAVILILLGLYVVWRLRAAGRRRAALLVVIAMIGGEALEIALKLIFHRVRPDAFFGVAEPITYSFPSGHALMSSTFYGAVAGVVAVRAKGGRKAAAWLAAALVVAVIGFSRVYLGVHYPTDVRGDMRWA